MKQVMPEMEANSDPNGKGRMKFQNRLANEHTSLKIAKEMNFHGHGISVISKNVIYMKCKNPPGTYDAPKGNISVYLYIVMS